MCAKTDHWIMTTKEKIKKKVNNKTREKNMCEVKDNDQ